MPLLPAEPEVFPPDLFADAPACVLEARSWWALQARPRQEKSLARYLHDHQVPHYLPLRKYRRRLGRNVRTSHLPLFPGYLFLLGRHDERLAALASKRVIRALAVASQGELWADLRQVHRLLGSGVPVTPEEQLRPGRAVEICSGPLAGLRGTILRTSSGQRFLVQVNFIQRGASVLVDELDLRVVDTN
jgi:transcriptional antiterminator RfaH